MMSVVAGSSSGALCGGCQLVFMAVVSWRNRNMKFVRKFVFLNFCVTQENRKELLEEEVPTELKVLLTLSCTLTSLSKHTTEDPTPRCLSRRRNAKMIYFKL